MEIGFTGGKFLSTFKNLQDRMNIDYMRMRWTTSNMLYVVLEKKEVWYKEGVAIWEGAL